MKKSKYMAGGGKSDMKKSKYMAGGGKSGVEVGKQQSVMQYKDYVKKMFGGGMTSEPALKKKRTKGMAKGGKS
mgnify:FL=1|tara:strand:- start:1494 stop:1712 length:219 start_codon:yes stop_codon:yes gene_type:complete